MRLLPFLAISALALLCACTPTLNWRELRLEPSPLKALLPCKPDRASRTVQIAGQTLQLQVAGCDAGGATFAVMLADLPSPAEAGAVLAAWRQATLLNMQATGASTQDSAYLPAGALALPQSVMTRASGQRSAPPGPVAAQAVWFSSGAQVFHAVMYAERIAPDAAETFFGGLALGR
jgi:hypothetical protein